MHSSKCQQRLNAVWTTLTLVAAGAFVIVATPAPAQASFGISTKMGIDSCEVNTLAKAQQVWTNTPYFNFHFYLGGADAGCPQNDPAFVNGLLSMGWKLDPIWVGPQPPCSSHGPVRFSSDPATASNQGKAEASKAYQQIVALGFSVTDTPITYDLEDFPIGNSACLTAARSFIQGWAYQMHIPPAQKAGLYGSTCASGLKYFADLSPSPDYITGAQGDGEHNVGLMNCGIIGWVDHQRHKQFYLNVPRYGFKVDEDCSDAPVYPSGNTTGGQGCV